MRDAIQQRMLVAHRDLLRNRVGEAIERQRAKLRRRFMKKFSGLHQALDGGHIAATLRVQKNVGDGIRGKLRRSDWKERHVQLSMDSISMFKPGRDERVQGIELLGATVVEVPAVDVGMDHCFRVDAQRWEKKGTQHVEPRSFLISASSTQERDHWVYMIRYVSERLALKARGDTPEETKEELDGDSDGEDEEEAAAPESARFLRVRILQARGLHGGFIGLSTLCQASIAGLRQRTAVVMQSSQPLYDEAMLFTLPRDALATGGLQLRLQLLAKDPFGGSEDFLGEICLPLEGIREAMKEPEPQWHELQPRKPSEPVSGSISFAAQLFESWVKRPLRAMSTIASGGVPTPGSDTDAVLSPGLVLSRGPSASSSDVFAAALDDADLMAVLPPPIDSDADLLPPPIDGAADLLPPPIDGATDLLPPPVDSGTDLLPPLIHSVLPPVPTAEPSKSLSRSDSLSDVPPPAYPPPEPGSLEVIGGAVATDGPSLAPASSLTPPPPAMPLPPSLAARLPVSLHALLRDVLQSAAAGCEVDVMAGKLEALLASSSPRSPVGAEPAAGSVVEEEEDEEDELEDELEEAKRELLPSSPAPTVLRRVAAALQLPQQLVDWLQSQYNGIAPLPLDEAGMLDCKALAGRARGRGGDGDDDDDDDAHDDVDGDGRRSRRSRLSRQSCADELLGGSLSALGLPPLEDAVYWYCAGDGSVQGPCSGGDLVRWVGAGFFHDDVQVCMSFDDAPLVGAAGWQPLGSLLNGLLVLDSMADATWQECVDIVGQESTGDRAIGAWSFDVFAFRERQLFPVVVALFGKLHAFDELQLQLLTLHNVMEALLDASLEKGVAFHGWYHAVSTAQAMYVLLADPSSRPLATLDSVALLMAALGQNIAHPGLPSTLLTASGHQLASLYSDHSPLEQFHAAELLHLLADSDSNLFGTLPAASQQRVRRVILHAVLSSDPAVHGRVVRQLSAVVRRPRAPAAVLPLAAALLCAADGSTMLRPAPQAAHWQQLLAQELAAAEEYAAAAGCPAAPPPLAAGKLTAEFVLAQIELQQAPLLAALAPVLPAAGEALQHLLRNHEAAAEAAAQAGAAALVGRPAALQAALSGASQQPLYERLLTALPARGQPSVPRIAALAASYGPSLLELAEAAEAGAVAGSSVLQGAPRPSVSLLPTGTPTRGSASSTASSDDDAPVSGERPPSLALETVFSRDRRGSSSIGQAAMGSPVSHDSGPDSPGAPYRPTAPLTVQKRGSIVGMVGQPPQASPELTHVFSRERRGSSSLASLGFDGDADSLDGDADPPARAPVSPLPPAPLLPPPSAGSTDSPRGLPRSSAEAGAPPLLALQDLPPPPVMADAPFVLSAAAVADMPPPPASETAKPSASFEPPPAIAPVPVASTPLPTPIASALDLPPPPAVGALLSTPMASLSDLPPPPAAAPAVAPAAAPAAAPAPAAPAAGALLSTPMASLSDLPPPPAAAPAVAPAVAPAPAAGALLSTPMASLSDLPPPPAAAPAVAPAAAPAAAPAPAAPAAGALLSTPMASLSDLPPPPAAAGGAAVAAGPPVGSVAPVASAPLLGDPLLSSPGSLVSVSGDAAPSLLGSSMSLQGSSVFNSRSAALRPKRKKKKLASLLPPASH
eukprot:PLAT8646.1.p1 GENE.PLAT8646.1~~PLAT8646.1.p1  ORF type:complete len:1839 (+),score=778.53 PLAT8646.1:638-5518(+)